MNKVLVVIDMQNDFIHGALAAEDGPKALTSVVAFLRDFTGQVYYTLDTHGQDYLSTQEGRNLPVPHCCKDTPGWEIPQELRDLLVEKQAIAFEKPSFGSPELALALAEQNRACPIQEVILVGICTDICVIANAMTLKSFLPETKITVLSSACAGVTRERHKLALEAMAYCQIQVL